MNDCIGKCEGVSGTKDCLCGGSGNAKDAATYLQKRLLRTEEALDFYGDPETYYAVAVIPDPPCGDFVNDFSEVDGVLRPGKRAREVLSTPVPE
jgi:hypothetical protein